MSQILVFSCEGDPALATARIVADWTVARLQQEGHLITALMGPKATAIALEQSLPPQDGLAAFSHGREDALLDGQGNVLLAQQNIHLLSNKWAWLFACRTAGALGALALSAGTRCFAGFEVALIVDWDESDVPTEIQPIFRRLMTEVPV